MIGCVVFVVYGLLLPTYSTAFMNGALFIVHIVYLIKDYLARKKNNLENNEHSTEPVVEQSENNDATEKSE